MIPYVDKKEKTPAERPDLLPDIERMDIYDPSGKIVCLA